MARFAAIVRGLALAIALLPAFAGAASADRVPTRAGAHPGYGRIVFDWPTAVGHSATVEGRRLTVRFDRPIESSFAAVRSALDGYIDSIAVAGDGRSVVATLKADFRLRTFRSGSRVVVDLMGGAAAVEPGAGPAVPAAAGKGAAPRPLDPAAAASSAPVRLSIRASRTDMYGRLTFAWPRKVPFTVDRQGQAVSLRFAAPATIDIEELRRNLPPQINAAVLRPDPKHLDLGLVIAADAQLRYFHNGADVVFDVVAPTPKTAAAPARVAASAKPPRRLGPAASTPRGAPAVGAARADSGPLVSVDTGRRGAEMSIRFNWREKVDAAVFVRNNTLWAVFSKPARIDLASVRIEGKGLIGVVEQRPLEGGSAVRLPMTMKYDVAVKRDGTIWEVRVGPARKEPGQTIGMSVQRTRDGAAQLVLPARKPGPVFVLADPDVGDSLYVVPLPASGLGLQTLRRFAEFELLDSPQGVAVHPIDERIRVARDDRRIVVSRPGGLTISDGAATADARPADRSGKRLLDLKTWLYGPSDDYKKIEYELLNQASRPDGLKRNAARLSLARFYVAHGMGAEAIGVIAALVRADPTLLNDPSFRALRGVANYLMGHYPEALADFDGPLLAADRQLKPWRAGIAAALGDWVGAHELFAGADSLIAEYPPRFAIPFDLLAAESALSVDDFDAASVRLSVLDTLPASGPQLDQVAYLRGHLLKKQDKIDKAMALWQTVIATGDRPVRAKAAFALVNALYEKKKIPLAEAIERLEQLRFAWRNDVFEFDLLHRLGRLYAENKDIRGALVTLRQAVTYFKDIKGAQTLTQEMRELFRKFYTDGDADAVPPVVALGLFTEFRELTPPGGEGDKMIRRLADRLVSVDLLSDAADLLDHLVRFRLKGAEKVETGTRLAEIDLADRKPDKALAALDASETPDMDTDMAARRRVIAVRAEAEAGRFAEALKRLGRDSSDEAEDLRARVQWRQGDWKNAALTLARISGAFPTDRLDDRQADLIVRRAVALALSSNKDGIGFLRERFGKAMEKSGRAPAFNAVVGRDPLKTEDYAALARQAAELDTFTGLMNGIERRPAKPAAQTTAAIN